MNETRQNVATIHPLRSAKVSTRCTYQWRRRSNPRVNQSMKNGGFQFDFSAHRPASVGVTVNETNSDVSVEMTTTSANSTRLRPTCPPMNAIGKNTTTSTSVIATAAAPISSRPSTAACSGVAPSSAKCRSIFSRTTVESSTRIPMTSDMPISEIVSSVNPKTFITVSAIPSEVGIETQTTIALRHDRKKNTIAIAVRKIAMSSVRVTIAICWPVKVDCTLII